MDECRSAAINSKTWLASWKRRTGAPAEGSGALPHFILHIRNVFRPIFRKSVLPSWKTRENIIQHGAEAGIRVCSGGIIGLGESLDQRVEMAFKLKEMHIDSVPLNILNPVEGTPFYDNKRPSALEILRTFAMFRFVLPKALIRTAGGRKSI